MQQVWEHSKQTEGALLVLLSIADFADDDGMAYPAIPRLAKKARLTDRQVQRVLRRIEDAGELTITRGIGRGQSNIYHVILSGVNVSPINGKGDIGDIERVTLEPIKGDITVLSNRHIEPSIEPSRIVLSEWFETLSEDPRWTGKNPEKYVAAIEKEFPNINLGLEAHGAFEWLQTTEGLKKKILRGFWRNWLKNANRSPPPSQGQVSASGRPTRAPGGRTAAELKAAQERLHGRGDGKPG